MKGTTSMSIKVRFDTTLTPTLLRMGEARQVVREVQQERKRLGLPLDAAISISHHHLPRGQRRYIKKACCAKRLEDGQFAITPIPGWIYRHGRCCRGKNIDERQRSLSL